jgi:arylsulfatase A-like enzyme
VEYPDLGCPETPFPWGESRPLDELPGRSVAGLLDGSAEAVREEVVIENDDPCSGLRPRMLVTDTHRLTIYPHTGEGELFDLRNDPHELYNLYDRPEAAALRTELTDRLLRAYSAETPLWPLPGWNA